MTAWRLAAEGATVAILDRDAEAARQVAGEVRGTAYEVDVRDGATVGAAIDDVVQRLGGLHILVNNAGTGDLRPLHTVDDKLWHRLIDVNLGGSFNATRAAVPHLLRSDRGVIVNNASLSGIVPTRNEAAYSAAKAAVIALTKSTALEYGPIVRANCVAPGFIRTPLTQVWDDYPGSFTPIAEGLPLRRMGEAHEVAEVIVFLCSDRSSYVTGQTLIVDGGLSLPQAGTDAALARLYHQMNP